MSAEETILNLFDTRWFEQSVFTTRSSLSTSAKPPLMQEQEDQESFAVDDDHDNPNPKLNRITTLMRKSHSDQFLSSKELSSSESSSPSPTSVLTPHLQTILSGKEVESFDESSSLPKEADIISGNKYMINSEKNRETEDRRREIRVRERRRRRKKSASKSLTELEVQELKGFMDLGFVFSDEDKDSRLVSIIPGLQRLGKTVQESGNVGGFDETTTSVSRPYLSEAWDCCREDGKRPREREKNPLMDWRIPAFGNEMELKDHLKFWAHTVASTVR